jgi:hypothetical protein
LKNVRRPKREVEARPHVPERGAYEFVRGRQQQQNFQDLIHLAASSRMALGFHSVGDEVREPFEAIILGVEPESRPQQSPRSSSSGKISLASSKSDEPFALKSAPGAFIDTGEMLHIPDFGLSFEIQTSHSAEGELALARPCPFERRTRHAWNMPFT